MKVLPQGWAEAPIAAFASKVGSGATPAGGQAAYFKSGTPLVRSMNVRFEGFDPEGLAFINDAQARKLDGVIVQENDILLNITGASIGRVTVAPKQVEGARVNQHVSIVRVIEGVLPKYVSLYLSSPQMQRIITQENYGVTRQALTKSMIENFTVPIAPAAEQRRIVTKIDSLSSKSKRAREHLDHIPRLVEKYKQAVLATAFTELDTSPVVRLRELTSKIGSGATPRGGSSVYLAAGTAFIRSQNVYFEGFSPQGLVFIDAQAASDLGGVRTQRNDVLLNITGASIGRATILPEDLVDGRVNQHVSIIRCNEDDLVPHFLLYFLWSPSVQQWIHGENYGVTRPALTKAMIEELEVPKPSIVEQKEIIRRIRHAFAWIDRLAAEATSARKLIDRLDQAVLAKAFRGELVPQDPDDEPASVLLERIRAEREAEPAAKSRRGRARRS